MRRGGPIPWSQLRNLQLRVLVPPQGHMLRAWRVPTCLPAQVPSALQALKKDEGVPWTGMLAIVRSYVTHKTGRTRARAPTPSLHLLQAHRRLLWPEL